MDTNSFWKGEAGVVGLVEDQAHTFKTKLYLKNGQVKDYSCTCEKGNSYRGICAHGEALFAYYKEYQAEMSKPLVHSSSQVHTMIREYTNQEVARILEEEEGSQVKLVPAVILNGIAGDCPKILPCHIYTGIADSPLLNYFLRQSIT